MVQIDHLEGALLRTTLPGHEPGCEHRRHALFPQAFPEHIAGLIDHVHRDRDSPGPSPDQVWQDTALEELGMGAGGSKVEKSFQSKVFYDPQPGNS